ncbi:Fe-S cluster assembly ATPase SufC [Candidatus Berkelbacteria bacterium]|nr:Fe-S cluster assembly ATPase SufC [Candidatus Berkelbacteria bacterium]
MLKIENLIVEAENKKIIDGLDLVLPAGETHVLMGANGSGKTTLGLGLMGSPEYLVNGSIKIDDQDLIKASADQRALAGLFLGFQHPQEIPGLNFRHFLRTSVNNVRRFRNQPTYSVFEFSKLIKKTAVSLGIDASMVDRNLNQDCSGGEKKKNELLQLLLSEPKFAIIDECDSGLDVDAIKVMTKVLKRLKSQGVGILLITHYERLINSLDIERSYLMTQGKILKSGHGKDLAKATLEFGYVS